jgi:hypothetical protein
MQKVDVPPPRGKGCFGCWTSEYLDDGLWGQCVFRAIVITGSKAS